MSLMFRRWGRYADDLAPILTLLVIVAISVVALLAFERDGDGRFESDEVDMLAGPLDPDRSVLDAQLVWALAWANGADLDRVDVESRFTSSFLSEVPFEDLLVQEEAVGRDGPYMMRGVLEDRPSTKTIAVVGRTGTAYFVSVVVSLREAGRMDGLVLGPLDFGPEPMSEPLLVLQVATGVALGGVAVVTWRRRRGGLAGRLGAAGVLAVAQTGQISAAPWVFTLGLVAGPFALSTAANALLAPLPRRGQARLLGGAAHVAAALASAHLLFLDTAWFGLPATPTIANRPAVAATLIDLRAAAVILVGLGVAALLVHSAIRSRSRLIDAPREVAGSAAALLAALVGASWLLGRRRFDPTMSALLDVSLIIAAGGVLLSNLLDRLDLGVARLVSDLGEEQEQVALAYSIGRALGDPTVELLYWSTELNGYVSAAGDRRDPDCAGPSRVATRLVARGEPLAVVLHDAALPLPDDRVAAVCSAARMALDNERLQAQVRGQLAEAQASRSRLVEAGDDARRRIERDLHDGAQQRLLSVLLQLRVAAARHVRDGSDVADELDRASAELGVAIEELRAIARGLHPPALDHGLATALEACAETAPIPVEVCVDPGISSLGPIRDAVVYFFVSEAVTNAVRHAEASHMVVSVQVCDGQIVAKVSDDGRGGAELGHGAGLQSLADRAAALGGALAVNSADGEGTTLTLVVPPVTETRREHAALNAPQS
jgi:signal transduction histidine kinase